jgi:hypothetical protein
MTKEQFDRVFAGLLVSVEKVLRNKADQALSSGAFDLESYPDDSALPAIVLTAALTSAVRIYRPLDAQSLREVDNLSLFL